MATIDKTETVEISTAEYRRLQAAEAAAQALGAVLRRIDDTARRLRVTRKTLLDNDLLVGGPNHSEYVALRYLLDELEA
jgi:hypothetical protein